MRKYLIALVAFAMLLPCAAFKSVYAKAEAPLPATLQYEYSGESVLLPVWPSEGGESYSVEVKDAAGNVLAENVLSYTFAMGSYTLEYTVYNNGAVGEPIATHTVAVEVCDTAAPMISLNGSYKKSYSVGESVTILTALGNDVREGEVACSVVVTRDGTRVLPRDGQIEVKEGAYTVTYTAQDSLGNRAERAYTFTVSLGEEIKPEKKKGCKSSVLSSGTALFGTAAVGSLWVKRRKRK